MDCTLQELAELLVELLAAALLHDDVCKRFEVPLDSAGGALQTISVLLRLLVLPTRFP